MKPKVRTTIKNNNTAKPAKGKAITVFYNCYFVIIYLSGIFLVLAISSNLVRTVSILY